MRNKGVHIVCIPFQSLVQPNLRLFQQRCGYYMMADEFEWISDQDEPEHQTNHHRSIHGKQQAVAIESDKQPSLEPRAVRDTMTTQRRDTSDPPLCKVTFQMV